MIPEEILKKIRKIEIVSKKKSRETFQGEYHSAFKGRGIEFSEVREYIPGDDVRFIDWNVSSRMGKLYLKQFTEERELTVFLVIDLSASLNFFSGTRSKKELAAEISAIIALTAMMNNDKVGLLIFTEDVELFIPPKKGRRDLLRIIREILSFKPRNRGTSIDAGLAYLNRVVKKRAIVFLVSDFMSDDFTRALTITSRKHDLVVIDIADFRERELPDKGLFILRDAETGKEFLVDFASRRTRRYFEERRDEQERLKDRLFRKYNVDRIHISEKRNYEMELIEFFIKRKRKYRQ